MVDVGAQVAFQDTPNMKTLSYWTFSDIVRRADNENPLGQHTELALIAVRRGRLPVRPVGRQVRHADAVPGAQAGVQGLRIHQLPLVHWSASYRLLR